MSRAVGNRPFATGLAGTLIAAAMAVLTFATLLSGRYDALEHARETSESLVSIISSDLERTVETSDLSLQSIVEGAERSDIWQLPVDVRQSVMFDRATTAGYLGGAYLIDAEGKVLAVQDGKLNPNVRLNDRDYFTEQARNPSLGLFISHPYRSRLRANDWSIGLSRRINRADGSFGGIALLAIRIDYLQRLVDRVNAGRVGSVFVVLDDGTLLARKPFSQTDTGANIAASPTFHQMTSQQSGSYVAQSSRDGVSRIFTFARVPGTPLIVAVAPAYDDVLQPWRRRSLFVGALTLGFGAALVLVSWCLAFALRGKVEAEAELTRLAATDPLTGLGNRRVLDRRLDEEWRRARRLGTALSVLFIDIDHFKLFNDTYGHAAGDEVLAVVAECIASTVRRPVDTVVRYGGEEFAVVLPDTPGPGAAKVAEKIRATVEAVKLVRHSSTQDERVTVSVGCATCLPADGMTALALLAAADERLYAAKAAGRNRIRSVVEGVATRGTLYS
ncbi:sensor domain-containing diguanylate cyclase [Paraburkholderia phosphatilytica]|uniref:GGDEF domain-containing protein n=1 Tax=Paraburkholderia phosphatilytica TaxID=2282883 RepID=UPI000E4CD062|nr:diguanylate cyclase [Paraburkholderia phosphatilytica]